MHVAGESRPGRVSRWRRDPDGWRAFVTYSRREPEGLLRYVHWVSESDLSPRDEDGLDGVTDVSHTSRKTVDRSPTSGLP